MLGTKFAVSQKKGLDLLCLGAHCDDIEIGCGGTILKLIEEYKINQVKWIVFSSNKTRKEEALVSARQFLTSLKSVDIQILDFKDGYLPAVWSRVKDEFEKLKKDFNPDIIFTHYRNDLHQDHRVINELTWNTYRNHLIFEYEIPKYDGDWGNPNLFVPLDEREVNRKQEIILNSFTSQLGKQWLDETLLTSVVRLRGIECASKSNFAEALYCRKMTI